LGVWRSNFKGTDYLKRATGIFRFTFKVFLAILKRPPKKNIAKVLENFYTAGIAVKIISRR